MTDINNKGNSLDMNELKAYAKSYARSKRRLPPIAATLVCTAFACALGFLVDIIITSADVWYLSVIFAAAVLAVLPTVLLINCFKIQSEILNSIPNEDMQTFCTIVRCELSGMDDAEIEKEINAGNIGIEALNAPKSTENSAETDTVSSLLDKLLQESADNLENAKPDEEPYTYIVDNNGNVIAKSMEK